MAGSGYSFILARWLRDEADIRQVREQVLVGELGLAREQLACADESQAYHVLVYDNGGRAVGTARMQPDGLIDYVAVLRPWRRRTVGGALLSYLHHIAWVRKLEKIWSVVPPPAQRFFLKNQFLPSADGVPAVAMAGNLYTRAVVRPGTGAVSYH
jgi:GNAT superfamily N-acetyltransferase